MKSFVTNNDIGLNILLSKVVLEYRRGDISEKTLNEFCTRINKFVESDPEISPLMSINVSIMDILYPLLKQKYLNSNEPDNVLEQFRSLYTQLFGSFKGCLPFSFFTSLLDIEYVTQNNLSGIYKNDDKYLKKLFESYKELYEQTFKIKSDYFKICSYNYLLSRIIRFNLIVLYNDFESLTNKISEDIQKLQTSNFGISFESNINFLQG